MLGENAERTSQWLVPTFVPKGDSIEGYPNEELLFAIGISKQNFHNIIQKVTFFLLINSLHAVVLTLLFPQPQFSPFF